MGIGRNIIARVPLPCLVAEKATSAAERQHLAGYLSVLFAAALFGSVFTIAKIPLATVDPLALAALTYTIAGLALIPFARASFRLATRNDYIYLLAVTATGAVAAPILLLYGLQQTEASDASILTNGEIIFTIILSAAFFGEKPKGRAGIVAIALVIVGLFMATTNMRLSETVLQFSAGNLMILAAMFMWAIDNNMSRRLTANVSPAKIAMVKSLLGGLVMLAVTVAIGRWGAISSIEPGLWLIIVPMSISGFGGALLLFLQGIKRIGTVKTMSMFSLVPIFGIAIAAVVLGEQISVFQGIATGLIIVGILIVSRR